MGFRLRRQVLQAMYTPHGQSKRPAISRQVDREETVNHFHRVLDDEDPKALYCCGGSIPTPPSKTPELPLTLRWDDPIRADVSRRVQFSIGNGHVKLSSTIGDLCKARYKDYTFASSNFSINTDPSAEGILEVIAQLLLPGLEGSSSASRCKSVLRKLHVRSITLFVIIRL